MLILLAVVFSLASVLSPSSSPLLFSLPLSPSSFPLFSFLALSLSLPLYSSLSFFLPSFFTRFPSPPLSHALSLFLHSSRFIPRPLSSVPYVYIPYFIFTCLLCVSVRLKYLLVSLNSLCERRLHHFRVCYNHHEIYGIRRVNDMVHIQ